MLPMPSGVPTAELAETVERRTALVDRLGEARVLRTVGVEAAMRAVPRHLFLPSVSVERAYVDEAIVTQTGPGEVPTSSASQPSIVAIMLEQLAVRPGHRVLEIGAGTGYNAALLAHLAGPSGRVTSIDIDAGTAQAAREHLARAGVSSVDVMAADGWLGHPDAAPYDRIEATVGIWDVSPHWVDSLVEGGMLVAPLWLGPGLQVSVAFSRVGRTLVSRAMVPCGFMGLRGPEAGPASFVRVADWHASGERLPDSARRFEQLLATPPRSQPAPPVCRGWLLRLALAGERAVLLLNESRQRVAAGFLDADAGSLALAEGTGGWLGHWTPDIVHCHGDAALLPALHAVLADPEPLEVDQLELIAVRREDPLPAVLANPRTWVVERPHHRYVVRARKRGGLGTGGNAAGEGDHEPTS